MNKKKYALYCRGKDDPPDQNQRMKLVFFACGRGMGFEVFEETETSRKTRPIKQEMLKRLRAGEYAGVVVFKLDCFAQSFTELILDITNLLDKGVEFISVSDGLEFTHTTGKPHFHLLSAFSDFERSLIRQRTIEGLRRTKLQGTHLGRPKGSRDRRPRKTVGYSMRSAYHRQQQDKAMGIYHPVEEYLDEETEDT